MKDISVIKGNLHTHTDEEGKHKSGYPVNFVLKFFKEEGFELLGITDHKFSSSKKAYSLALKKKRNSILIAPGYEMVCKKTGFHIVRLFSYGIGPFKIYAHPFRSFGEKGIEKFKKNFNRKEFSAIELDNYVFFNPEILNAYKSLISKIPIISNSDFHNDIFMLKNSFTLYLAEKKDFSSIRQSIKEKNIICVFPDFKKWELKFLPQSPVAEKGLEDILKRNVFQINPYRKPENMDLNDFKTFYKTSLFSLNTSKISCLITPEFGGRIVSLKFKNKQLFSPLFSSHLETPYEYGHNPTFEANYSEWEIVMKNRERVVMKYEIKNKKWKGITLFREIKISDKKLIIKLWQKNSGRISIPFDYSLSFNLFKKTGKKKRVVAENSQIYFTPLRGVLRDMKEIFFPELNGKNGLKVRLKNGKIEKTHIWDDVNVMRILLVFWFKNEKISPKEKSNTVEIELVPY